MKEEVGSPSITTSRSGNNLNRRKFVAHSRHPRTASSTRLNKLKHGEEFRKTKSSENLTRKKSKTRIAPLQPLKSVHNGSPRPSGTATGRPRQPVLQLDHEDSDTEHDTETEYDAEHGDGEGADYVSQEHRSEHGLHGQHEVESHYDSQGETEPVLSTRRGPGEGPGTNGPGTTGGSGRSSGPGRGGNKFTVGDDTDSDSSTGRENTDGESPVRAVPLEARTPVKNEKPQSARPAHADAKAEAQAEPTQAYTRPQPGHTHSANSAHAPHTPAYKAPPSPAGLFSKATRRTNQFQSSQSSQSSESSDSPRPVAPAKSNEPAAAQLAQLRPSFLTNSMAPPPQVSAETVVAVPDGSPHYGGKTATSSRDDSVDSFSPSASSANIKSRFLDKTNSSADLASASSASSNFTTRTQQKLWLQRDLNYGPSTPVSAEFRRELERIAKEYMTIKKYYSPLVDSVERVKAASRKDGDRDRTGREANSLPRNAKSIHNLAGHNAANDYGLSQSLPKRINSLSATTLNPDALPHTQPQYFADDVSRLLHKLWIQEDKPRVSPSINAQAQAAHAKMKQLA